MKKTLKGEKKKQQEAVGEICRIFDDDARGGGCGWKSKESTRVMGKEAGNLLFSSPRMLSAVLAQRELGGFGRVCG